MIKPIVTEKAVMLIESHNTLTFETNRKMTKGDIKNEIGEMLDVKIENVRTFLKGNKKYAYIKLDKNNPAIDVATKLGII